MPEEEAKPKESYADAILTRTTNDYYRATQSWHFFLSSNGPHDNPKKSLFDAINAEHLNYSFNVARNLALSNCMLSICRLTDSFSKDRHNLSAIRRLLSSEEKSLLEAATSHYGNANNRAFNETPDEALRKYASTMAALGKGIDELLNDEDLKSIRDHRNNVLAHSLGGESKAPKINSVNKVLDAFQPIIVDAYYVIRHSHFLIEILEEQYQPRFDKFWMAVERGALKLTDDRNRELDAMKKKYGLLPDGKGDQDA